MIFANYDHLNRDYKHLTFYYQAASLLFSGCFEAAS